MPQPSNVCDDQGPEYCAAKSLSWIILRVTLALLNDVHEPKSAVNIEITHKMVLHYPVNPVPTVTVAPSNDKVELEPEFEGRAVILTT